MSLLKGHILISLSCAYMNTPDAKAGGKGKGWEAALALSLCQQCLWCCPNPGTAVCQPMASSAGTCHQRGAITECPELGGMPRDHPAQHQWNPLQAASGMLLREVGSILLETPPLSRKFHIRKDPFWEQWQIAEGIQKGVLWGSCWCTDQEFVTLRMPELKRSLQREPKKWRKSIPEPVTCWDGCQQGWTPPCSPCNGASREMADFGDSVSQVCATKEFFPQSLFITEPKIIFKHF